MDLVQKLEKMNQQDLIAYMEVQFQDEFKEGFIRETLSGESASEFKALLIESLTASAAHEEEDDQEEEEEKIVQARVRDSGSSSSEEEFVHVNKKRKIEDKKEKKNEVITTTSSSSSSVSDDSEDERRKKKFKEAVKPPWWSKPPPPVKEVVRKKKFNRIQSSSPSSSSSSSPDRNRKKKTHQNDSTTKKYDQNKKKKEKDTIKKERESININSNKKPSKNFEYYRKKFKLKHCRVILVDIQRQDCHWRRGDKVYRDSLRSRHGHSSKHNKDHKKSHHHRDDHSKQKKKHGESSKRDEKQLRFNNTPRSPPQYQHEPKKKMTKEDERKKRIESIKMKVEADISKRIESSQNNQKGTNISRILSLIPLPLPKIPIKKKKKVVDEKPPETPATIVLNSYHQPRPVEELKRYTPPPSPPRERERQPIRNERKRPHHDDAKKEKKQQQHNVINLCDSDQEGNNHNSKNISDQRYSTATQFNNNLEEKQDEEIEVGDNVSVTSSYCRLQMEQLEITVCGQKVELDDDELYDAMLNKINSWFAANDKDPYFQSCHATPETDGEEENLFLISLDDLSIDDHLCTGGCTDGFEEVHDKVHWSMRDEYLMNFSDEEEEYMDEYVDYFGACLVDLKSKIRIGGTGRETVLGQNKYNELLVDPDCFKAIFKTVKGTCYDRDSFVLHCKICEEGEEPVLIQGKAELKDHINTWKHRDSLLQTSLKLIKYPGGEKPKLPHPDKLNKTVIETERNRLVTAGMWTFDLETRWRLKEEDVALLKKTQRLRKVKYVCVRPEDHMNYSTLWGEFWNRRHDEISETGGLFTAEQYPHYSEEWVPEWRKIVHKEYVHKLHEIIVKYGLDVDTLRGGKPCNYFAYIFQPEPFYIEPAVIPDSPEKPDPPKKETERTRYRDRRDSKPEPQRHFSGDNRAFRGGGRGSRPYQNTFDRQKSQKWPRRSPSPANHRNKSTDNFNRSRPQEKMQNRGRHRSRTPQRKKGKQKGQQQQREQRDREFQQRQQELELKVQQQQQLLAQQSLLLQMQQQQQVAFIPLAAPQQQGFQTPNPFIVQQPIVPPHNNFNQNFPFGHPSQNDSPWRF